MSSTVDDLDGNIAVEMKDNVETGRMDKDSVSEPQRGAMNIPDNSENNDETKDREICGGVDPEKAGCVNGMDGLESGCDGAITKDDEDTGSVDESKEDEDVETESVDEIKSGSDVGIDNEAVKDRSEKAVDAEAECEVNVSKDFEFKNSETTTDTVVLQETEAELKEKVKEKADDTPTEDDERQEGLELKGQSSVLHDSQSVTSMASEDSITQDSASETDIEVDIAIVTEGKSKKPTLAAVVKDEHGEGKLLVEALSDAARFSYCSVCAVSLGHLFENEFDRRWRKETMKLILHHLKLPEQCTSTMYALIDGMGGDNLHAFVDTLLKDPILKNNTLLLPEDLVTLALQNGGYDARMRVLIFHVAWHLRIRWKHLEKFEEILVKMITQQAEETEEQKQERQKKEKKKKRKRYALIGLATVGGGAAIGLTAGLAAPFIAAGLGAIIGTSAAAALSTTAGIAIMTSLFGAAGAGLTGFKMKKRVGAIEQFEFSPLTHGNHLHVAIAITGWVTDEQPDNFHRPWVNLAVSKEQYYLIWESKYLLDLGRALEHLLNGAVTMATQEALKYTVLSGLLAALTWPVALLSVAGVIDNPWGVAMQRAKEVGRQLADVIMSRQQGNRPVTLIGFSLGAKVIFSCLEEMAERKGCEGLIEEVILLGTPAPASASIWSKFKRVVAGRIINGYCRGDWLLRFVYRTASAQMSIAGLQPIKWEDRRMVNVDLSDVVSGHLDYSDKMDTILRIVGVSLRDHLLDKPSKDESKTKKTPEDDGSREPVMEQTGVEAEKESDGAEAEIATEALDEMSVTENDGEGAVPEKSVGSGSGKQGDEPDKTEEELGSGFAFQDNWYSVVPQ